jgi:hypothetical protein
MKNLKIKSGNAQVENLHTGGIQEPKRNRWNHRRRYSFLTQYKFI